MVKSRPGVVVYTYNPSTWRLRQEDGEFKARLDYITRPCLKNKQNTPTRRKTATTTKEIVMNLGLSCL
jgi:hypothetical protein